MDMKSIAAQMMMKKFSGNIDAGAASDAIGNLLGGGDTPNLGGLVQKFSSGGLADKAKSWLGDGTNEAISGGDVTSALGVGPVKDFAAKLGIGEEEAADKLSDVLPNLIDGASSGGNLLDSVGGVGKLAGMASKFMK